MVFLKAFTVFIICISIFKIIISESLPVENKNNPPILNVTLSGTVNCEPCGGKEVSIVLTERGVPQEDIYYANCTTRDFYIHRYLTNPKPGDYYADFFYVCKWQKQAEVRKRNATYISVFKGITYYDFGYINLKKNQKKKKSQ